MPSIFLVLCLLRLPLPKVVLYANMYETTSDGNLLLLPPFHHLTFLSQSFHFQSAAVSTWSSFTGDFQIDKRSESSLRLQVTLQTCDCWMKLPSCCVIG